MMMKMNKDQIEMIWIELLFVGLLWLTKLSLGVLRCETSYLRPLDTFFLYRLISSASTWKPSSLPMKTLILVESAS